MIEIKYNKLYEVKSWIETLLSKQWLDKHGYFYNLNIEKTHKKIDLKLMAKELKKRLSQFDGLYNSNKKYIVFLSRYGVYGSYYCPNKVIVNVQRKIDDIVETVVHELIHLELDEEVKKQELNHEEKERYIQSEFEKRVNKIQEHK